MEPSKNLKEYILSFIITGLAFLGAYYVSTNVNKERVNEVKILGDKLSLDITSSETQFDLLKESSCKIIKYSSTFSDELVSLSEKISYLADNISKTDPDVVGLKKYYSLLEIKDYLLVNNIAKKCDTKPITIIYFYHDFDSCDDCKKLGYVMARLQQDYPEIHIYSFDYDLDLSAIKTMVSIYGIKNTLPAVIVNDEIHYGFQSIDDMEILVPELKTLKALHEKEAASSSNPIGY